MTSEADGHKHKRLEDEELQRMCAGIVEMGNLLSDIGPKLLKRSDHREEDDGHARARGYDGAGGRTVTDICPGCGGAGCTECSQTGSVPMPLHSDPTGEAGVRRALVGVGADPVGDAARSIRDNVPQAFALLRAAESAAERVSPVEWRPCTCSDDRRHLTPEGTCMTCGNAVAIDSESVPACTSHGRFGIYAPAAKGRRGRCWPCYEWPNGQRWAEDPPESWIREREEAKVYRPAEGAA